MDLSGLLSAKVNVKAELRQDESFVAAMQAYLGGRVSQLSDEADRVVQELSNRLREVWERQGRPWSGLVVLFDSLDHVRGTDFSEVRRALQTLFDQHGSTIRLSSARMVFVVPQWLHLDGGVRRVVNVKIRRTALASGRGSPCGSSWSAGFPVESWTGSSRGTPMSTSCSPPAGATCATCCTCC